MMMMLLMIMDDDVDDDDDDDYDTGGTSKAMVGEGGVRLGKERRRAGSYVCRC